MQKRSVAPQSLFSPTTLALALLTACAPLPPALQAPARSPLPAPLAEPVVTAVAVTPAVLAPAAPPARPQGTRRVDVGRTQIATDARHIADWALDSGNHEGLPFLVVDKVNAKVYAFGADGRLRGTSAALLGSARGDDSVPGIGDRKIADIRPDERTTPAGRFAAELGENAAGEDILWVDYDSAVSMHRMRATKASERRAQRLATATAKDNRISYGCINVPAAFFDGVVKALFSERNGIVYVLPEMRPVREVFNSYEVVRSAKR